MNRDETLSSSILKAFGIPADRLQLATKHLSKIILANFLSLVETQASRVEREALSSALSRLDDHPNQFSTTVSEVMANNQDLQEKTAQMINDLYKDLIQTFLDHASTEEKQQLKEQLKNKQVRRFPDLNL